MTSFKCHICEWLSGEIVLSIKNYPAYIVPVPGNIAPSIEKGDIDLYVCQRCGHMQIPRPDPSLQKLIYEVYYSYYSVDSNEALVPHYREPFINFVSKFSKEFSGDLLEIGCSAGENIDFFSSFSKSYTGVDPSSRIKDAQKKFPQHQFIQGFFPQALPAKMFDVIVTQFNLEHITNVIEFISNIHKYINPGGVLLIQVPDCGHFLSTKQPNFLAHEHVQYFVKDTLSLLLRTCGFDPIAWGEEGPSLITAAVKMLPEPLTNNYENGQANKDSAKEQAVLFNRSPDAPKGEIVFYGVGPQLYWLLSKWQPSHFAVVDDNKTYHQQGLPGYTTAIQPLSASLISKKNVVLSLNTIYHGRVLEKIRLLNSPCTVTYLQNNSWITENVNL